MNFKAFKLPVCKAFAFCAIALTVLLGVFLRIKVYLLNRSLWLDEAALANNMLLPHNILNNMEYAQAAPPLFKLIEIMNMSLLRVGAETYALRLFPLFCGLASIVLFVFIADKILNKPLSKIFANLLFALNYLLIYYSSEVKQYSSDVFVTLLIFAVFLHTDVKNLGKKQLILLGLFLSGCFWLSHASMFVLAGVFAVLLFTFGKDIKKWLLLVLPSAAGFIPFYFLHLKTVALSTVMQTYWQNNFIHSFASLADLASTYFTNVFYPISMNIFLGAVIILGAILLARNNLYKFALITSPLIMVIIASILHKYPIAYRLCLFLVPVFLLYVSKPLDIIAKNKIPQSILTVFLLVTAFFLYFRIYPPIIMKKNIWYREEMRPLLTIIQNNKKSSDKIFITPGAHQAFRFYNRLYNFEEKNVIVAPYNEIGVKNYTKTLEKSMKKGEYYWVVFVMYREKHPRAELLYEWLNKNTQMINTYVFYENYLFYVKKN